MKVLKSKAVALLTALEVAGAEKLSDEKLAKRLKNIASVADDETELDDEELAELLQEVMTAAEAEADFEIEEDDEEEAEAPPAKKAPKKKAAKAKPEAAAEEEAGEEEEAEEAATEKPAKKGGKKTAKKKAAAESSDLGVRESITRPYIAGIAFRALGLGLEDGSGVVEAHVEAVDKAMPGKINRHQTSFTLRNAWHAIRGYNAAKSPEKAQALLEKILADTKAAKVKGAVEEAEGAPAPKKTAKKKAK